MVTKHGKAAHCGNDCPFLWKSSVIQSLSWCSHCDPKDALEKRAWSRRIKFLNLTVVGISFQSRRFLFHRCTQDFPVALTLTMAHQFNAMRANVSCAKAQTGISASFSYPVVLVSVAGQWNCSEPFLEAGHPCFDPDSSRVSSCETYLLAYTCSIRL